MWWFLWVEMNVGEGGGDILWFDFGDVCEWWIVGEWFFDWLFVVCWWWWIGRKCDVCCDWIVLFGELVGEGECFVGVVDDF